MKRISMLLAAGLAMLATFGCATAPKLTPAQFFAAACPPVQQAFALAPQFSLTISASVEKGVQDATPMVAAACTSGAAISAVNVQQFADTVLPAAGAVVEAAPATLIADTDKLKISGAIALAQLAVDTVSAVAQRTTSTSAPPLPGAALQ